MESKKINQLATNLAPLSTDLTIVGDPITGVSKKITLSQIANLFAGSIDFYANLAAFPVTGTINIIYCAKDTQKLYLWSGSAYVEVFPSQAVLNTYQLLSEKGVSNGYASLDSGGKVPIAQLPSSIMEYKGLWSAATNTPTLANGTGDTGDVYICSAAGSVNFGAGAITFAVGDYVIYSGTIWQRSSGAVGTVTSVAITESGDSLNITGSPITTSGTINIGFNGTNLQYVNGAGNLTTFPILTGYVPYTGATTSVDLGLFSLTSNSIKVIGDNSTYGGTLSIKQSNVTSLIGVGYTELFGKTNRLGISFGAGSIALLSNSILTAERTYTLPNASGTIALTSDIPILTGYVPYTGATANVDLGTFNLTADVITGATGSFASNGGSDTFAINHSSGAGIALNITKGGNGEGLYINKTSGSGNAATIIGTLNATTLVKSGGTSSQFLKADGTVDSSTYALDSAVVHNTGNETVGGTKTFSDATKNNGGIFLQNGSSNALAGYMNLGGLTNGVKFTSGGGISNTFTLPSSTGYTFTFPNATGTLALTSDLSSYVPITRTITGLGSISVSGSGDLSANRTISIAQSSVSSDGYLSATDFNTFNNKQNAITLTTTGTSGAATLVGATLNIPQYTDAYTGTVTSVAALTIGTSGTDLSSSVATSTTTPVITLNVPTASATNRGALSSADWTTFNNKQSALTNPVTGTGTTNYLPKFTGASTIGNSQIQDDGTVVSITRITGDAGLDIYAGSTTVAGNSILGLYAGTGAGNLVPYGTIKVIPETAATNTRAANMLFSTRNSAGTLTESFRIFSTQNVGIGTGASDSGYKLDVNGTGRFKASDSQLTLAHSGGTYSTVLVTNSIGNFYVQPNGSFNALTIASTGAATFSSSVSVNSSASNIIALDVSGNTGNGVRQRFLNQSASGLYNFQIGTHISAANAFEIGASSATDGASFNNVFKILNTGAATFSSTCTATGFFESSDMRIKTLIQDNYQTKGIASITPKLYTKNGKVELGYYAQDFVGILDSAVSKGSDDMLSLSYREVHTAKIYALEQRIKELEGRKFNISTTKLK